MSKVLSYATGCDHAQVQTLLEDRMLYFSYTWRRKKMEDLR
jgi:hypothetical protein